MLATFAVTGFLVAFDTAGDLSGLLDQGKYTEAETVLKLCLQGNPAPAQRAEILLDLVEVYRQSGRPSVASPLVDEAVRLASLGNDDRLRARSFHSLANGLRLQGRNAEAGAEFRRALRLAPASSDERIEILIHYAQFLIRETRLAEVEPQLKEALRQLDGSPDPARLAVVLYTYAMLRFLETRYKEASQVLLRAEEGLPASETGSLRGEILNLQGLLASRQGARGEAALAWRKSSAYYRQRHARFGTWIQSAEPLLNLAGLLREQRRFREALSVATEADVLAVNTPEPNFEMQAVAQNMLGCIHADLKRWLDARKCFQRVLALLRQGDPQNELAGIALLSLATVAWHERSYTESADLLERARPILARPGVTLSARVTHLLLHAKVARALGNKTEAAALEEQAKTLYATGEHRHTVSIQALRQK